MELFWWREKPFKAVWRIGKEKRSSLIVGSAHFFPYRFEKTLTRLIQKADTVLFEGPLDQESMARVAEYGRHGEDSPSLYDALDPRSIREINRQLAKRQDHPSTAQSYLDLVSPLTMDYLRDHLQGVRPWMGFFSVWSSLLNFNHSMDVEAHSIARGLDKRIEYLETIEDQLAALDDIPFERFVTFLNRVEQWKDYRQRFLETYLSGNLDRLASMAGIFPTRCESILTRRDPIFFERMKSFFENGPTTAFIGMSHVPGVRERFLQAGYSVTQEVA